MNETWEINKGDYVLLRNKLIHYCLHSLFKFISVYLSFLKKISCTSTIEWVNKEIYTRIRWINLWFQRPDLSPIKKDDVIAGTPGCTWMKQIEVLQTSWMSLRVPNQDFWTLTPMLRVMLGYLKVLDFMELLWYFRVLAFTSKNT